MKKNTLDVGDPVIFKMSKASAHPGPRAKTVYPAPRGEFYTYVVDKLWVVEQIREDGNLVLLTRRGKRHVVSRDDSRLRAPHWWERLRYRGRFPRLGAGAPAT